MFGKILDRIRGDKQRAINIRLEYNIITHMWDLHINGMEYERRSHHSVIGRIEDAMREARINKMQQEVLK